MSYCEKLNNAQVFYYSNLSIDPCTEYQLLNDSSRLLTNHKMFPVLSDQDVITLNWYRLTTSTDNNLMIPTYCTSPIKCQTFSTGWINGSHPTGNFIIECLINEISKSNP